MVAIAVLSLRTYHFRGHVNFPRRHFSAYPAFCKLVLLAGLGFFAWTGPAKAQQSEPVSRLSPPAVLSEFPAGLVDKVVIPVPGEVFMVLDKLGDPNWSGEIRDPELQLDPDRIRLALSFGATVAEGFVAVQAERPDAIEATGKKILRLAAALGIESAVTPHCYSILESAKTNDWKAIRRELDRTEQTVRDTMEKLQDDELAICVSLGGWLRGTQAVTSLISETYSEDNAELLNQPDLVSYFEETISEMSEDAMTHPDVAAIRKGLAYIHAAMTADSGSIAVVEVNKIRAVCADLLSRFYDARLATASNN